MSNNDHIRYPIGKFRMPETITDEFIPKSVEAIEQLPELLKKEVEHLTTVQLDTPYRDEGWTIRQVVHHLADSHLNAYVRCKLALTEDSPVIKPYYEDRWAEVEDAKHAPVEVSLHLLKWLHTRWVMMFKNLKKEDWSKTYFHPESKRNVRLIEVLGLYAWHCKHHTAHITSLKERMGWK